MDRDEIEKLVEPIIRRCLREFGDFTPKGISDEECASHTKGTLRPDVRRVSLLVSLAQSVLKEASGEGLEVGCGYGYLLFPMARFLPRIHWSAVDHPCRAYLPQEEFRSAFREYNCDFVGLDLTRERLPFPDAYFHVVTFSEVLEHLPVERVNFVLSEIARVTRPGGVLLASSPNQASLENRLRLLKGNSILDMPDEVAFAKGIFGHIRLYTPTEMSRAMSRLGFGLERSVTESNASGYRGNSEKSWRRRLYRWYERAEAHVAPLRRLGDTWYMAFRKNLGQSSA
jgi:SAM-dependent methyltransferase